MWVGVAALLVVPLAAVLLVHPWSRGGARAAATTRPRATMERAPEIAPVEAEAPAAPPALHGRILDADGNAVNGAAVRVLTPGAPIAVHAEAKSDAQGAFAFARAPAEPVRVEADHGADGAVTSAVLRVEDGRSTEVTLVLAPAVVRGTVVDGEDHPVSGATLSVEGLPWDIPNATSEADGTFRMPTVPEGATSVVAVAAGFRSARAGLPARQEAAELVVHLRLGAASPVAGDVQDPDGNPIKAHVVACEGQSTEANADSGDDGTFELPPSAIGCLAIARHDQYGASDPAPVVEGKRMALHLKAGGAIEGVAVDERGAAIESFTVGVESFTGAHGRGSGGPKIKVDDPRGAFRLEKLAPGSYVLSAGTPSRPPARSDAVVVSSGATTTGVRIVIAKGGTVVGRVLDEKRAPLEGVEVRFDTVSSVIESESVARSDASGQYRLEGAPAGPFTLHAEKDGYRTRLVSGLRVASGGTVTQDITLHAPNGAKFEFTGIGAGLSMTNDGLSLNAIFPGNPAEKAGLKAGDRILTIDGETTDGMSAADALQRLRGEEGSSVGVSVRRQKTNETVDVVVERADITR